MRLAGYPRVPFSLERAAMEVEYRVRHNMGLGGAFEVNPASTSAAHTFRPRLLDRRNRLQAASNSVSAAYLNDLIAEIDAALGRIDGGSYGLCETCHDTVEADRLEQNPAGEEYTEGRLLRSLRDRFDQGADAMADGVLRDASRFRETGPPVDDMTLLVVRRNAPRR
jgi:hypothetical protein